MQIILIFVYINIHYRDNSILVTSRSTLWMRVSIQNFGTEAVTHTATEGNTVIECTPILYPHKLSPGVWLTLQLQSVPIRICFLYQCAVWNVSSGRRATEQDLRLLRQGRSDSSQKREREKKITLGMYIQSSRHSIDFVVEFTVSSVWCGLHHSADTKSPKNKKSDMSSDWAQSTDSRST